ncbi:MAG: YaiI/YqxD family protein [Longimicrobiales bacterium]
MKLWVDGDGSPRDVKEVVFRAAKRVGIQAVVVANRRVPLPGDNAFVSAVQVDGGPDVADGYIVDHAEPGDIAVTADIPLAALLVAKHVSVIDPRGQEYDEENVGERLAMRDFMDSLRGANVETGGSAQYGARDKQAFAGALDRLLVKALRRR